MDTYYELEEPRPSGQMPTCVVNIALSIIGTIFMTILYYFYNNIFWIYVLASTVTACFYGIDKGFAKMNECRCRLPEILFHALALFGGWPGGILGQTIFCHKTSKHSFQVMFRSAVAINMGVFLVLALTGQLNPLLEPWMNCTGLYGSNLNECNVTSLTDD